jgi:phosphoesterase RecJ-like protein
MPVKADPTPLDRIAGEIGARGRLLLTSHARPDGDSIGSQLALAFALDRLGKQVRIVNRDPVPPQFAGFPGAERIEVADRADTEHDALVVLECTDLSRPDVAGLDRYFVINIDHHLGNTGYGAVNWFDESAAACGEMVADLVDRLGVALTPEIAVHVYLAILTDTGSFRHGHMTARTFETCRRAVAAGVDPAAVASAVYDSSHIGRLRLIGAVLDGMRLEAGGRVAVLRLDEDVVRDMGCTHHDAEGLVNMPLTAREVLASVLFKVASDGTGRVSLRSKGAVDVRRVAGRYGGGGHTNASGFTAPGRIADVEAAIVAEVAVAVQTAAP